MAATDERQTKENTMGIAHSFRTWRRSRVTTQELNRLSQRSLEDIGIFRSDIPVVARQLAR